MPRTPSSTPTEVELTILRVLWDAGPSTVRQIHDAVRQLEHRQDTGYSTTLKMVQVMSDKGLLLRDESVRPQVYRPADPEEKTQLQLLDHLIQRGFGGSAMKLVLRALSAQRITPRELAEARRLIERAPGNETEEEPESNRERGVRRNPDRSSGGKRS